MNRKLCKLYIPRLMALLLAFVLVFSCAPSVRAEGESGSCGGALSWSLSAGTLTISGSGAMSDYYDSAMAPWYHLREEIQRIVLPSGLTHVGNLAFYECSNVLSVSIPGSVDSIGEYAFAHCEGMQMLSLGSVRTIGRAAFSDCYSLQALDLPGSLQTIGPLAFYRCQSISTVTVPGSVTSLGVSAFAYCKNLISADVQARVNILPEYCFYGCERLNSVSLPSTMNDMGSYVFQDCDQLSTVYYDGSAQTPSQLQSTIGAGNSNFGDRGTVSSGKPGNTGSSATFQENQDGSFTLDQTTVTQGDNSSVTTKVESSAQPGSDEIRQDVQISITVNGDKGWEEAKQNAQKEMENLTQESDSTNVNVFVKDTENVDASFVQSFAGKDVNVTITTSNGSVWKVNTATLKNKKNADYDLSYILTAGSEENNRELGSISSYCLRFVSSAEVDSEVRIALGRSWSNHRATLFQRGDESLEKVQTVVVDSQGRACFYLASVDKNTEYYIAMDLPGELYSRDVVVSQDTVLEMAGANVNPPMQYEITGRKSSWNMELGQVMGILAAVMVGVTVLVGVVMFIWNKKRLKNGYVPQWDEDE